MPPGKLLIGEGKLKKTDFKKLVSYPDMGIYYPNMIISYLKMVIY